MQFVNGENEFNIKIYIFELKSYLRDPIDMCKNLFDTQKLKLYLLIYQVYITFGSIF